MIVKIPNKWIPMTGKKIKKLTSMPTFFISTTNDKNNNKIVLWSLYKPPIKKLIKISCK